MSSKAGAQPVIPMAVFRKMVAQLPAEELSRLPPEKLPENIPLDLVDEAPYYSRRAVEGLILSANAYHLERRLHIQEQYGPEVMSALDKSQVVGNTANVKIFWQKLEDLRRMYEQWRKDPGPQNLDRLGNQIRTLNALLLDVRAENADTTRSAQLLREQVCGPELEAMFQQAIERLHEHSERIENLLARYFRIRITVAQHEMQVRLKQINTLDRQAENLREQIEDLRTQLEDSQTLWRRAVKRLHADQQAEHLQSRIMALAGELRSREVSISETQLTQWLDALVDAALHPLTRPSVSSHMGDGRMALYSLLSRYCQQQENSARQIARNPFLQVDPAQAIRFVLLSEQFILDYFRKKRNETTAWISDVAQVKSEDLDGLEREILSELKRSSRFKRKPGG
ncbi:hypothetical protein [Ectothiorhodospira variabilis]|uniref:hypothetical protein n=1 Tax=Ectothiorhodospira variabilis TaxID=505694 RepID=UPI001EFBEC7E|nr:hypothetical protein [Ectothiorhodospira variabilis]MCG5494274.1 hypothetical protein [Ectothiorhodospira variabilis]MCG5504780.1 hypothetical protein [Ectothiorhodospira variabilis]MCG5507937.1 hypothetical protein [Ectothiorhodospira variabilis]